jgi:hypothetical protein
MGALISRCLGKGMPEEADFEVNVIEPNRAAIDAQNFGLGLQRPSTGRQVGHDNVELAVIPPTPTPTPAPAPTATAFKDKAFDAAVRGGFLNVSNDRLEGRPWDGKLRLSERDTISGGSSLTEKRFQVAGARDQLEKFQAQLDSYEQKIGQPGFTEETRKEMQDEVESAAHHLDQLEQALTSLVQRLGRQATSANG